MGLGKYRVRSKVTRGIYLLITPIKVLITLLSPMILQVGFRFRVHLAALLGR